MPWSRSRPAGSTTSAIYRSAEHRRARIALIAAFTPGDPCCLCGHPMWHSKRLNADHLPGTNQYRGLAHGVGHRCTTCGRACNQVDAARRARERQTSSPLRW